MSDDPDSVTLDEFLLTLSIPRDLPDAEVTPIRRTLHRRRFSKRLQNLVSEFLQQFPTLAVVSVTVSR